jgi:hypothetical protein
MCAPPGDSAAETQSTDFTVDRASHQLYSLIGTDRQEVADAPKQYVCAIETVGLVVKPSKVVVPTADGIECLGA